MPFFVMFLAMLMLACAPARAETVISLAPAYDALLPMIRDTLISVLAVAVTWVLSLIKTKTGLDIEARHREALQGALTKAVDYAIQLVAPDRIPDIRVRNEIIGEALGYVMRAVPDAIRHFGLSESALRSRILARLPIVTELKAGDVAVTVSPPASK